MDQDNTRRSSTTTSISSPPKCRYIRRCHTGCSCCRKRGKKCDEAKPKCSACVRLGLNCIYRRDFAFRHVNIDGHGVQSHSTGLIPRPQVNIEASTTTDALETRIPPFSELRMLLYENVEESRTLERQYLAVFDKYIRLNLPAWPKSLPSEIQAILPVKYAILGLSASHLAILECSIQTIDHVHNSNYSFRSPKLHAFHYEQSKRYADIAEFILTPTEPSKTGEIDISSQLVARVLLAYYHHSTTSHAEFRQAVWLALELVQKHNRAFMKSPLDLEILQFWHRLYLSCGPSKLPTSPLEGEGGGIFVPTLSPSCRDERISVVCNTRLSPDDLIYSILIRTIELRARSIVNRCVAHDQNMVESDPRLGQVVQGVLKDVLNNPEKQFPDEALSNEGATSFATGKHLIELLKIQRERLNVWRSLLQPSQLPTLFCSKESNNIRNENIKRNFSKHRDAMSYLYCLLCELIFVEMIHEKDKRNDSNHCGLKSPPFSANTAGVIPTTAKSLLQEFFSIIESLDFAKSNVCDVYTFSLTEMLRQLTYSWRSEDIFHNILTIIWPKIEATGLGFEHSHLPTHLAKKWIIFSLQEYSNGEDILLSLNAMPEATPRGQFLDVTGTIDVVVCGVDRESNTFIQLRKL